MRLAVRKLEKTLILCELFDLFTKERLKATVTKMLIIIHYWWWVMGVCCIIHCHFCYFYICVKNLHVIPGKKTYFKHHIWLVGEGGDASQSFCGFLPFKWPQDNLSSSSWKNK